MKFSATPGAAMAPVPVAAKPATSVTTAVAIAPTTLESLLKILIHNLLLPYLLDSAVRSEGNVRGVGGLYSAIYSYLLNNSFSVKTRNSIPAFFANSFAYFHFA